MTTVSDYLKEAAEIGSKSGNSAAKLGYALGFISGSVPSSDAVTKLAHLTRIPEPTIKLAIMLKRAGPLAKALGLGTALTFGIPAVVGATKGISQGTENLVSSLGANSSAGVPTMANIGGMTPQEIRQYEKLIMQQALRNSQSQALLNNLRMANTRPIIGGGPAVGA